MPNIIREFLHRHEAGIAKGLLDENGIECVLEPDDCGGLRAAMSFGATIKLIVKNEDVEKAIEILKILDNEEK